MTRFRVRYQDSRGTIEQFYCDAWTYLSGLLKLSGCVSAYAPHVYAMQEHESHDSLVVYRPIKFSVREMDQ